MNLFVETEKGEIEIGGKTFIRVENGCLLIFGSTGQMDTAFAPGSWKKAEYKDEAQ
jgi:hypothetical protein